jgi:hypothetical protein
MSVSDRKSRDFKFVGEGERSRECQDGGVLKEDRARNGLMQEV